MTETTLIPERVAALADLHLLSGAHADGDYGERMCAMEAVAWIAGEPMSDTPQCSSVPIASFMRAWNDGLPDADRDRLLKPLLPRLVGSRGTRPQEHKRGLMALDWHNGVMLPAWLDLVDELKPQAEAVRADPLSADVIREARSKAAAARDAAWAAAWAAAAGDAALAAARAAARDAAWAAAAGAAAWAAARAAARDAAAGAALAPTVAMLQESALDLVDRMLQITEAEHPRHPCAGGDT